MELELCDLSVALGGDDIVRGVDLAVRPGEVVGVVGPNGSGKSTVLRCLYRAVQPAGGVVRVGGDELTSLDLAESARRMAALTQESSVDLDFTVREIVSLGRTPHLSGNSPLSAGDQALCAQAMRHMDVAHLAERSILTLSGGERQRVLVARALAQEPRVLVLDEPTNHLDVRHQLDLLGHLRHAGPTVVVVLHDLNLAAASCDRLAVLADGQLVACGPPREVLTPELVREVFAVDVTVVDHPVSGHPQILFTVADEPARNHRSRSRGTAQ